MVTPPGGRSRPSSEHAHVHEPLTTPSDHTHLPLPLHTGTLLRSKVALSLVLQIGGDRIFVGGLEGLPLRTVGGLSGDCSGCQ